MQAEAREHGAQVVADAGEHGGALLDLPLDALLHVVEGDRRLPHLAGASRRKAGHGATLAEIVDCRRQPQDRPDLVAQEDDGNGEQYHRGRHHPPDEDDRIGDVGFGAGRKHAQHIVVELDADLDQARAADGVDPERLADLAADLLAEHPVQRREERLGADRRQRLRRQHGDVEAHALTGDAGDGGEVGILRIAVEDIHDGRDLADHGGRELVGDQLPVALHEDEADQRLEQHHGRDDDDERAGEQALGQDRVGRPRHLPPAGAQAAHRGCPGVDRRRHGDCSLPIR